MTIIRVCDWCRKEFKAVKGTQRFCRDECKFWPKVDRSGGPDACWQWTSCLNDSGYGYFWSPNKHYTSAHRFSYTLACGPIGAGLFIMHSCDNPKCVNPQHLRPGTAADNVRDRDAKERQARGKDRTKFLNRTNGERNANAKMTDELVMQICRDGLEGLFPGEIAKKHGFSSTNVSRILRGESWKHLPRPIVCVGKGGARKVRLV